MRCPKCHYLSFDPEPRCRNCGYGFAPDDTDLLMREPDEPEASFADLRLHETPLESFPSGSAAPLGATASSAAVAVAPPVASTDARPAALADTNLGRPSSPSAHSAGDDRAAAVREGAV